MQILLKTTPVKLFLGVIFVPLLLIPIGGFFLERFGDGFLMLDTIGDHPAHLTGPKAWFTTAIVAVVPLAIMCSLVFLAFRKSSWSTRNLATIATMFIYIILVVAFIQR